MNHYFTNNSSLESKQRTIKFEIKEREFVLKTDIGVFCKNYLDEGSKAFIKVLLTQNLSGRILDVGCGYGPIGLVLASFIPHGEFLLIDVNARACMLARENAKNMNLSNGRVVECDIYQNVTGMFDNIVTNPPIRAGKKVIYKIFEDAKKLLTLNGSFYVVIRKDQGEKSASKFIENIYGNCELIKRDKGYYIYRAINQNN